MNVRYQSSNRYVRIVMLIFVLFITGIGNTIHANQTVYTIEEILEINSAGVYPVEVSYKGENNEELSKIIYMQILFPKSYVNTEYSETIDAQDAIVPFGTMKKITDKKLIEIAKAKAWHTANGADIPITTISKKVIDRKTLHYEVEFKTANGTPVTINILETKKAPIAAKTYFFPTKLLNIWYLFAISLLLVIINIFLFLFSAFKLRKEQQEINILLFENNKKE